MPIASNTGRARLTGHARMQSFHPELVVFYYERCDWIEVIDVEESPQIRLSSRVTDPTAKNNRNREGAFGS
jgi:hypothetical protein